MGETVIGSVYALNYTDQYCGSNAHGLATEPMLRWNPLLLFEKSMSGVQGKAREIRDER